MTENAVVDGAVHVAFSAGSQPWYVCFSEVVPQGLREALLELSPKNRAHHCAVGALPQQGGALKEPEVVLFQLKDVPFQVQGLP
eukprot:CAMPEP_0115153362 /NCGR_PEP_ID=MMETSP0227-20121206/66684_1 /TAXON_ID=89957 /ORGANISM="Polarella glacialis, Strain CCMP 1383" /LENGTH=83 /DNA_ID=CAMNT_0002564093 /DNA_START=534 /DNA_END=785 /DNA_ORIENTATION=+